MPPKVSSPGPPPKDAIEYFEAKEITPGFDYTDVWKEEHTVSFTVAKLMEEDILDEVRTIVDRALREGMTFHEFQKQVGPMLDSSGWSDYHKNTPKKARLKIVFDTNMRTARSAGQWQRIQRTKKLVPYLTYYIGPSLNHREIHVGWDGVTLPVDDPWWLDHLPTNGYGCKCGVRQVGTAEMKRLGGVTERPPSFDVEWENKKTGKTEMVPVGIDPGFNYNPGIDRLKNIQQQE